ncbi:hypothetical protein O181_091806 [Austropuccinia psidii MF-1]|uniref:Uncharacterized protein n=1 Tax=Austropuccinia psidii MF-1 TaxID=1389203 RepID=A0A9Q3IY87_9BASI|nr:hypothetical protein [Austropuccinia psidii MF-1]
MSFKLTELTEYSSSVPPPSVLCGSGILSQLASPWSMASSGQTYDGYKEAEVLDTACAECLAKGKYCFQHFNPKSSNTIFALLGRSHVVVLGQRLPMSKVTGSRKRDVARWTNVGWSIPVGDRPIYSSSAFLISRINTEGVVKHIRQISYSPPDLDAEASDELDGEEFEVVHNSIGHKSSTSPSCPPSKRFQSHIIPSTPRTVQTALATIPTSLPPASPNSSHTRPAMIPEVRPFLIQKSRTSPIVTSRQIQ